MAADGQSRIRSGLRRMLRPFRSRNHESKTSPRAAVDDDAPDPPPPYLPARRPLLLTPRQSRESITAAADASRDAYLRGAKDQTGAFFNVLPPELRISILVAAFGQRTLHLDLRLNYQWLHAESTTTNGAVVPKQHCDGQAPFARDSARRFTAPKTWQWWSCVCHRQQPPALAQRSRDRGYDPYRFPRHDECASGDAAFCDFWPYSNNNAPYRCCVGVMGWLLACRQAYAEGIHVLYSTNTFFIESTPIFDALFIPAPVRHDILLPQRVASIRSLELRWNIRLFGIAITGRGDLYYDASSNRRQLASHLGNMHLALPDLRRLVLSFAHSLYVDGRLRPIQALDEIDRILLQPIARLVSNLSRLERPVVVEVPRNVFIDLRDRDSQQRLGLRESQGHHEGVWLRYPVLSASKDDGSLAMDAAAPQETLSAGPCAWSSHHPSPSGSADNARFYYIKEGVDSDLFWDHNGEAQLRSQMLADRGIM